MIGKLVGRRKERPMTTGWRYAYNAFAIDHVSVGAVVTLNSSEGPIRGLDEFGSEFDGASTGMVDAENRTAWPWGFQIPNGAHDRYGQPAVLFLHN